MKLAENKPGSLTVTRVTSADASNNSLTTARESAESLADAHISGVQSPRFKGSVGTLGPCALSSDGSASTCKWEDEEVGFGEQVPDSEVTVDGIDISLDKSSLPPRLELHCRTTAPYQCPCVWFNEHGYPYHDFTGSGQTDNFSIPITMQKLSLDAPVSVNLFDSEGNRQSRMWQGIPTINFTCQDLISFNDLEEVSKVSMDIVDVLRPAPQIMISLESGYEVIQRFDLQDLPRDYGTVKFELPFASGCRSYFVNAKCGNFRGTSSATEVGKWYHLPPSDSFNGLREPALPTPNLTVTLHEGKNLARIETEMAPPENQDSFVNKDPLLSCWETQCADMPYHEVYLDQLSSFRFKLLRHSDKGFQDSCFTTVPTPTPPSIVYHIGFPSTLNARLEGNEDPTARVEVEKEDFVEEFRLCPRMASLNDATIARFDLQWSQSNIKFRNKVAFTARMMRGASRDKKCSYNPTQNTLSWSFAGINDSCETVFKVEVLGHDLVDVIGRTTGKFDTDKNSFSMDENTLTTALEALGINQDQITGFRISTTELSSPDDEEDGEEEGAQVCEVEIGEEEIWTTDSALVWKDDETNGQPMAKIGAQKRRATQEDRETGGTLDIQFPSEDEKRILKDEEDVDPDVPDWIGQEDTLLNDLLLAGREVEPPVGESLGDEDLPVTMVLPEVIEEDKNTVEVSDNDDQANEEVMRSSDDDERQATDEEKEKKEEKKKEEEKEEKGDDPTRKEESAEEEDNPDDDVEPETSSSTDHLVKKGSASALPWILTTFIVLGILFVVIVYNRRKIRKLLQQAGGGGNKREGPDSKDKELEKDGTALQELNKADSESDDFHKKENPA
ncbi:unnamed protein product [Cyprideis torosa]|uniref:Uncharacterized protein n=1 Tax=Cyprideis torosa TaxID=163714 RepID=A0A7R8W5K8_9CRUS|nr:unnamed protein product [Cyprideis torosa]CAG0885341.1 unnamed protein product [Cyprideis torosa]